VSDRELSTLEDRIGRILRLGVLACTTVLSIGLLLWFAGARAAVHLLDAGLVLLMTIPIARILASFADAIHRRDRLLSWATAAVLLILSLTIAYSLLMNSGRA
jgi:uncharacterized membrane protein